ncbi:hypothetical protein AB1Y20_007892 [Prymnesium parvum]|uniref:HIT domain-containing protein n=1 Tax=Prymnesium parvum TaxID=97485 RepID=A0AB34ITG2_PRYPA
MRAALLLGATTLSVAAGYRLVRLMAGTSRVGVDERFGALSIGASQLVLASARRLAVAFELNPILAGHLVVAPRRCVQRVNELDDAEYDELWRCVRQAQVLAEGRRAGSRASNLLLKEGVGDAPLHVHVVPRTGPADFERDDQVFDELYSWVPLPGVSPTPKDKLEVPPDSARRDRSAEQMAAEAATYRGLCNDLAPGCGKPATAHAFSKFPIASEQIFYTSPSGLTCAFVNLRPLANGHVLVTPRRIVPRIGMLTDEEYEDLWRSVRDVQKIVEAATGASQSELGVQDGREAGQSVPHVHVHVLPH